MAEYQLQYFFEDIPLYSTNSSNNKVSGLIFFLLTCFIGTCRRIWDILKKLLSSLISNTHKAVDKLNGFTIEWNSQVIHKSEFANFNRSTRYIRDFIIAKVLKMDLKKTNAVTNSVRQYFNS